jgi:hypothetical protein
MILTCFKHQLLNQLLFLWFNTVSSNSFCSVLLEKKNRQLLILFDQTVALLWFIYGNVSCCWSVRGEQTTDVLVEKHQQILIEFTTTSDEQDNMKYCLSVKRSAVVVLQELLNGGLVWLHNISWWITWKSPPRKVCSVWLLPCFAARIVLLRLGYFHGVVFINNCRMSIREDITFPLLISAFKCWKIVDIKASCRLHSMLSN